jgi:hypothetical protein
VGDSAHQLLGDVLLNYPHHCHPVAMSPYHPRYGRTLEWPVRELLTTLTGDTQPMVEWRRRWRAQIARS